jgi:hypothetical protein
MPRRKKVVSQIPELINFYELEGVKKHLTESFNPNFHLTQIKIPCRIGVVAPSGIGKSNFVMNFIRLSSQGEGTWSHIFIVHKIDEGLYDYLKEQCKDQITFYKKLSDLPAPKDLMKDKVSHGGMPLIIFDDIVTEKNQKIIEDYFIYGRKINNGIGCSCLYLSQRYFAIPKVIRAQFSYLIILKIREKNDISAILRDCSVGLDKDEFMEAYEYCTKEEMNFMKLDLTQRDDNKIISKNFTQFIPLSDFIGTDN